MKQKNVKQELIVEPSANAADTIDFPEYIDAKQTLSYATHQAKHLTAQSITLTYVENWNMEQEEIAAITLKIPNISIPTIEYAVEVLDGQLIEPNTLFSFLEIVVLPSEVVNSEEEFSFLASGLYALALHTDLEILERHARKTPTGYLEAGLEAVVDRKEERDLKLHHANDYSFTIEAVLNGEEVELALTATNPDLDYSYSIENVSEVDYRTIYRYNPELSPGVENVLQEGKVGKYVEVYRMDNTAEVGKELMARDFYPPIHQIIEVAVEPEAETEMADEMPVAGANERQITIEQEEIVTKLLDSKVQSVIGDCEEDPTMCEETDEPVEIAKRLSGKDFWELLMMLYLLEMFEENQHPAIFNEERISDDDFPADWLDLEEELETEIETEEDSLEKR